MRDPRRTGAPPASAVLVPEFAVADLPASPSFHRDVSGFEVALGRPEERFSFLRMGAAQRMLRDLAGARVPGAFLRRPLGQGLNRRITVGALEDARVEPALPIEERWHRTGAVERGRRRFAVADPDGCLIRFCEVIGVRAARAPAGS